MSSTYTVKVEQEGEELILPLPPALLEELGWEIGQTLKWIDNKDGTFTIQSADNQKS